MVHYLNSSQVSVVFMATWVESVCLSNPEDEICFPVELDTCEMRSNTHFLRQYKTFDSQGILFVHSIDQALAGDKAMDWCFSVVVISQSSSLVTVSIIFSETLGSHY